MDRLAHFHFIIIFSSHRWSSASFCSPRSLVSFVLLVPSSVSVRTSLSLPELIPTAEPGEPVARHESSMSPEWNPRPGKKIAEREILLPGTASFPSRLANRR